MTDRLDLPQRYRNILEGLLREHVPDADVWAYGSRITGESHEGSDLDLVVRSPDRKPVGDGFFSLLEAIECSNIPILIQAHDWARLPESFHPEIEREYVVIQEIQSGSESRWLATTWGELATLEYGKSLRGYDSAEGPYRVYGTNGPIGKHNEPLCPHASVIIGRKGAYRGVHYSPDPFFVIDTAFWLKPKGDLDTRWAYYQLLTQDINGLDSGSAIPSTSREDFYGLPVDVPPLTEQHAIAHVLGTLDDKIELNRRMNETLEEMARALFKSWFVDFDPVHAKTALKQHAASGSHVHPATIAAQGGTDYEVSSGWTIERARAYLDRMDPSIATLFPDRFVDSELGEIPEGWEVKALGEVVELNPTEPMKRGTVAPYLDMASLPTFGSSPSTPVLREFKSGTRFRDGDTLFARITPCLENGKTAFVQVLSDDTVGWGSTEFIVLRAIPPAPPEYTYLLARDTAFREHAIQSMTGTSGRQRVQVDALAPYTLPNPPAETWNEFSILVSPLFAQMEFNRKKSLALTAQRDAILPKLVTGDVQAGEALNHKGIAS